MKRSQHLVDVRAAKEKDVIEMRDKKDAVATK